MEPFEKRHLFKIDGLYDLNRALMALSYRPITMNRMREIVDAESLERLNKALNQANTHPGAARYLSQFFVLAHNPPESTPIEESTPPDTSPASDSVTGKGNGSPGGPVLRVHGPASAVCFIPDTTRSGVHTLRIDVANAVEPKGYAWRHKLSLQLTREELPQVAAVMLGYLPRSEGNHHGDDHNKGFALEMRAEGVCIELSQSKCPYPVAPVLMSREKAFYLAQLLLQQIRKNAPALSVLEILQTLDRLYGHPVSRTSVSASRESLARPH